jgi:hypothetical protein
MLANDDDPDHQSQARQALIANASTPQGAAPSFLDSYATALDAQLKNIINSPSIRVRLNAAIVAAKVAEKADNTRLSSTIAALMMDKSEGVALWGLKGARAIMPAVLRNPLQQPAVLQNLIPAVQAHPTGAVVQEAYAALNILGRKGVTPQMQATVTQHMLALMGARVKGYLNGIPDEPMAEAVAETFLADVTPVTGLWNSGALTPQLKMQILQGLSDLVSVQGQRAAVGNQDDLNKLVPALKWMGATLQVIAGPSQLNDAALLTAAADLRKVEVGLGGASIAQKANAASVALQNNKQFGTVNPPPKIQVAVAPK